MSGTPSFSVVVNTFNRAASLADTLSGLVFLDHPDFEVVVVNGPSTDGTDALLDRWAGRIKVGRCPDANLSASRNAGIALAAGDVVAFIDDDAVPHPAWLRELSKPYADPEVGGVGGFTIDNTGVRFQAAKTLCDRFGNAFHVSPYLDERPFSRPGSPHYPSLLGTNSSFRREALLAIGGFDHTFAYFLDETDVCLRMVDAGHAIHYAPNALVFHRYAPSHLRTLRRIPRSLLPSCVSKAYFVMRHGASLSLAEASRQLDDYRTGLLESNRWHAEHGNVTEGHYRKLDGEVREGIETGRVRGMQNVARRAGDLSVAEAPAFLSLEGERGLVIAMVSQGFPPDNEAGIARWTATMAAGLSRRGHQVHVVTRAEGLPSTEFQDGYWVHRIRGDRGGDGTGWLDLPPNLAEWAEAVRQFVTGLRTSFGVEVASFPIWDLEGLGLVEAGTLPVVMSLHTTYALAKPFKPAWQARLIYGHRMVGRVIRREGDMLARLPVVLANSRTIMTDIEAVYGIALGDRAVLAPHGTDDPFEEEPNRRALRAMPGRPFTVAFVGRFEPRKGFDLAAAAALGLLAAHPEARAVFAGDVLHEEARTLLAAAGASVLPEHPSVELRGQLTRRDLDDLYATVDVVLMPSRYESFGLVAIEAMAAGAPVVGLDAGGLREVVEDGVSGFLVPLDGEPAAALAERLGRLARDPGLLARMGDAARAAFEREFTIDRMVERAEAAYRAAVGTGANP